MKKIFFWIFILTILGTYLYVSISQNLKTERNTVTISLSDTSVGSSSLSVAVIGDVHLPEGSKHLDAFKKLVLEIKSTQPDLVVFVGDYTSDPKAMDDMSSHRKNIINIISVVVIFSFLSKYSMIDKTKNIKNIIGRMKINLFSKNGILNKVIVSYKP